MGGTLLEELTWQEAEAILTEFSVVVIPLGAGAKEHGPHLPLKTDYVLARYFRRMVLEKEDVVVAPTMNYHYYPAFVEYPGSTSLRFETARDLTVDVVASLTRYGPKRFYVLNTGISTKRPLAAAAEELAKKGILLRYSDFGAACAELRKEILEQERGAHADEGETSIMLYIAPCMVDMSKAVKDVGPDRPGPLTRDPNGEGTYSPSGCWGDPTLATSDKGHKIAKRTLEAILEDIAALRVAELPRPEAFRPAD